MSDSSDMESFGSYIDNTLVFPGVSSALYTEKNDIYLLSVRSTDGNNDYVQIIKYNISTLDTTVVVNDTSLPVGNPLPSIWVGRRIIMFGGQNLDDGSQTDKILSYNPGTERIEELNVTLPYPSSDFPAVWSGDLAYLFLEDGVHTFDPINETLTNHTVNYPQGFSLKDNGRSGVWVQGKILFFYNSKILEFDPDDFSFNELDTELPTESPSTYRSSVYTRGQVYIIGGKNPEGAVNEIIKYDPEEDEAELNDTKLFENLAGCNVVSDGVFIYIYGGFRDTSTSEHYSQNVYRYDYRDIIRGSTGPGDMDLPMNSLIYYILGVIITTFVVVSIKVKRSK